MPRVEQVQQKALEEFRERNRNSAKRKKTQNSRQIGETVVTFVCLFFLLSLLFLQVAKKLTPKVDTTVGNNTEVAEPVEAKASIDDRLKLIQFNDAMAASELQKQRESEIFNEELDEKVIIPSRKSHEEETSEKADNLNDKVQKIISKNITDVKTLTPETQPKPAPTAPTAPTVAVKAEQTAAPTVSKEDLDKRISAIKTADIVLAKSADYKVLVGKYQTAEQAQLAKSIIRETELGQNAFVKFIDNAYTIQIGSYSTAEQAASVARQLTTNSFPARIYYEKPAATSGETKTIF